jgi:hypothetical protein
MSAAPDAKAVATAKALCCLRGLVMHNLRDDRGVPLFVISREAETYQVHTLDDVHKILERVGGPGA